MSSNKTFIESLKELTPARIGIGAAGTRYPTKAQLQFLTDLAAARDSVRRNVPEQLVRDLALFPLQSLAKNRTEYLMSTTLGRQLSQESEKALRSQLALFFGMDVLVVASDGLSTEAFEHNVPSMLPLLVSSLKAKSLRVGPTIFVERARVGILDTLGEIIQPKAALILLGERPGLVYSDSLSAYFEYAPNLKRVESDRNVLSNIHAKGIPPTEAALMLADALEVVLTKKQSGMQVRFEFN